MFNMNRKSNYLKLIVFFFSLFLSTSSYASRFPDGWIENTFHFHFYAEPTIPKHPVGNFLGIVSFTSYLDQSNPSVSAFSAKFNPSSFTPSFDKSLDFTYQFELQKPAWYFDYPSIMKSGSLDNDETRLFWHLTGINGDYINVSGDGKWSFFSGTSDLTQSGTFLAAPIPSTVWLFISGFIGLIGFRRKRKR
jgi:hypothetical protein